MPADVSSWVPTGRLMVVVTDRETQLKQVKSLVRDNGLPPSPRAAGSLLGAVRARTPNYERIGAIVATDAALAAALVSAANFAAADPATRVATVRGAYTSLGPREAASLIEQLLIGGAFPYSDHPRLLACWQTSAAVAELARRVAARLGCVQADVAETFALFRDCGMVALLPCLNAYDAVLQEAMRTPTAPLVEIEDARFAINHARAGALLAQGWHLPASMVEAIRDHHDFAHGTLAQAKRNPEARRLIAVGLLAEEIDARARTGTSCRDWLAGAPFVHAELGLASAQVAELATTLSDGSAV